MEYILKQQQQILVIVQRKSYWQVDPQLIEPQKRIQMRQEKL